VNESVYLGDRLFIFSNSPGTILHRFYLTRPDRPSRAMQREKSFQDAVFRVRDILDTLEEGKT
jgi:ABC-type nitrate/sulfonate/bicarbonate transport system ATPase subunit